VTGSSIIALKYDKGVVLACDNLLSYGSTLSIICINLEFKFVNRIEPIAKHMVIAATGEYADFQEAVRKLRKLEKESSNYDDGIHYSVREYSNYLAQMAYAARNDFNPYFNTFVFAGFDKGERFLGTVDHLGNYFHKDYAIAGFAKYFCMPILVTAWKKEGTLEEAKKVIYKCFEVLFARDCHAVDNIRFAVVDDNDALVEEPVYMGLHFPREMRTRANEKLW
jgi:20S proteasome subunit beta 7